MVPHHRPPQVSATVYCLLIHRPSAGGFFCPAIGPRARQNFMQFFAAQRRIALTMRLPGRLFRQKTRVNADNILRKGEYFSAHKISTFRQLIVKYI
jgi:hypothetical protein